MSPILSLQRRMMELGRVRLGEKGPKGEPRKRDTFRFTTASQALALAVADKYGGEAEPWPDAPDGEGYWQVSTDTAELAIILPPVYSDADGTSTTTWSQWFELWSGGGCQRRCDGETEMLSGSPCICRPLVEDNGEDARECQVTTRVSFMLPDIPGLGVWRLDSHGWNAATELPGTLELLVRAASEHAFIEAVLRIEQRVKKQPGQPTKRFVVPVIDLPSVTLKQLASGDVPLVLNAPRQSPPKPPLPSSASLPTVADLGVHRDADVIPFGDPPEIAIKRGWAGDDGIEATNETLTPESLRSSLLEEELLAACGQLDVDLDDVRKAIDDNRGDDQWLKRQVERARENLALRQAEELV
jgi:hypothetical protein